MEKGKGGHFSLGNHSKTQSGDQRVLSDKRRHWEAIMKPSNIGGKFLISGCKKESGAFQRAVRANLTEGHLWDTIIKLKGAFGPNLGFDGEKKVESEKWLERTRRAAPAYL